MSQYDSLKQIIAEAKPTTKPLLEEWSEISLPELKAHHAKISDHLANGEFHPDIMAKLRHVHHRLSNTINNVETEIEQHREMADYHDEHSYGGDSDEAPYSHRDFAGDSKSEVRDHLRRINDSHEEIASHHSDAAEWHRQTADDLENGEAMVPEEHFDNTPFDPEKHGQPSPNDP